MTGVSREQFLAEIDHMMPDVYLIWWEQNRPRFNSDAEAGAAWRAHAEKVWELMSQPEGPFFVVPG